MSTVLMHDHDDFSARVVEFDWNESLRLTLRSTALSLRLNLWLIHHDVSLEHKRRQKQFLIIQPWHIRDNKRRLTWNKYSNTYRLPSPADETSRWCIEYTILNAHRDIDESLTAFSWAPNRRLVEYRSYQRRSRLMPTTSNMFTFEIYKRENIPRICMY